MFSFSSVPLERYLMIIIKTNIQAIKLMKELGQDKQYRRKICGKGKKDFASGQ